MPNRFARKAGNHNATDVWSDTPSGAAGAEFIPGASDVAYSNNFDITIVANWTVQEVRNDVNGSGATAGKGFSINDGVTLTGNVFGCNAAGGNTYCVALSSGSATIAGSVTAGSASGKHGAGNTGTGTLTITGSATGSGSSHGAVNASSGNVVIQGTAQGSNVAAAVFFGALNSGTGTLTVANAVGGAQTSGRGAGVGNSGGGAVVITGTATGGTTAPGADNYGTGTMTVGTAVASATIEGAQNTGAGTLTVNALTLSTGAPAVSSVSGLVRIASALRRRTVAQGGDPTIFPVRCLRWELTGAAADRVIEMLDPDDSSVTEYRQATDAVIVDADLLARLQQVATVATTGAQIAALGPTE